MLKMLIEGFQESLIVLDCSVDKDLEIKATIQDSTSYPKGLGGGSLDIYV
jgi:hypothetical protein